MNNIFYLAFLIGCLAASTTFAYTDEALLDQIESLPGAEKLDLKFNQFSGYVKIGSNLSKNMV